MYWMGLTKQKKSIFSCVQVKSSEENIIVYLGINIKQLYFFYQILKVILLVPLPNRYYLIYFY